MIAVHTGSPGMNRTRVFEIDHPRTLTVKVKRLKDLLGTIPGHVSFVSVDFDRQDFTLLLRGSGFQDMGRVPETLRKTGETWTFGLRPEELQGFLSGCGFSLVTDIGSTEYRSRYIGASGRHLKGFEFYRAALAEI